MYGHNPYGGAPNPYNNALQYGQPTQTSYVPSYAAGATQSAAALAAASTSNPYGGSSMNAANIATSSASNPYGGTPVNAASIATSSLQSGNSYNNPYSNNTSGYGNRMGNHMGNMGNPYSNNTHNTGFGGTNVTAAQYGTNAFQNVFAQQVLQQMELNKQQQWFVAVDRDRSGTIDVAELSQLTFGGKKLTFDVAKKLITVFDRDRNGGIDFAEYITLYKFITAMQSAFTQTDFDRNGVLDYREIGPALQKAGFQLTPQAVNALHHRYNKTNTGIDFIHFLEIAADVALLRVEFDLKDHQRKGAISLRFDDLLSIVANI